jgi:hypothetical protein
LKIQTRRSWKDHGMPSISENIICNLLVFKLYRLSVKCRFRQHIKSIDNIRKLYDSNHVKGIRTET